MSQISSLKYVRQTQLPEIGEQGQVRLGKARVLIVGAGGLGAPAALYLAGAGVGTLLIADGDCVDLSNLHRQILYRSDDLGQQKSDAALGQLERLNPDISIESIDERLDEEGLEYYVPEVGLVLDCSDNLATRLAVNAACFRHQTPLVSGAAVGWSGQLSVFDFRGQASGPCYQCLYGESLPETAKGCAESGIVGPVVGLLGTAMALEAIKLLAEQDTDLERSLVVFDGKAFSWQRMALTSNPICPVCSIENGSLTS